MKTIYLITFLSFFILNTKGQNMEVHYLLKELKQISLTEGKTKELMLEYQGIVYKTDTAVIGFIKPLYLLDYPTGQLSIQTSESNYSVLTFEMDTMQYVNLYNLNKLKHWFYNKSAQQYYIDNYRKGAMRWKILSETKEINGLKCKHAVTYNGRDTSKILFDIWYTPDIKMEFGLLHLKNAPGLVVEGSFPMMNFSYTLKYFKQGEPIDSSVFWPKEFNKVKFEDYSTPLIKTEKDKKKEAINNQ